MSFELNFNVCTDCTCVFEFNISFNECENLIHLCLKMITLV